MPPRRGGAAVIVAALSLLCFLLPTSAISARGFGSKNHPARHVHELPNRSLFRCFQVRQQQRRRRRLAASVSSPTGPPPKRDPVLILPGFVSDKASYLSLKEKLESQGYDCDIIDVNAIDWAPTFFGQSFEFYLERIEEGALSLLQRTGSRKLNVVGHSAGGWLARLWMGSPSLSYNGRRYHGAPLVSSLICLGTPHYSFVSMHAADEKTCHYLSAYSNRRTFDNLTKLGRLPIWTSQRDNTRGTIGGGGGGYTRLRESQGEQLVVHKFMLPRSSSSGREDGDDDVDYNIGRLASLSFQNKYSCTCRCVVVQSKGNNGGQGDGVTDLKSSLLEGSEHVVLPGCMHSPSSSSWYGSEPFFDAWAEFLL
eukprot:jgi/Bigna1/77650/fgenesh1_pg.49_\